jgi:hypothetical protein
MAALLSLSGCTSSGPTNDGFAWRDADAGLSRYTRIILEPVEIDRRTGASFGGASDRELQHLTEFTRHEFVFFAQPYVATFPGPGVARLKLTLTGLENNVAILATLSRAAPTGLAMNAPDGGVQGPGAFTGSATLSAQLFDSETGAPLGISMQKYHPRALDMGATFNSQAAHEAAITEAAKAFCKWLDDLRVGVR